MHIYQCLKKGAMLFKNACFEHYFQNILKLLSKTHSLKMNLEATMLQVIYTWNQTNCSTCLLLDAQLKKKKGIYT